MSNQVKWLGHATFEITSAQGLKLVIDPWYEGNPSNELKVEEAGKIDAVLITHDHFDHLADASALLKQTGATLVGQPEIGNKMKAEGMPEEQLVYGTGMNIGGSVSVDGVSITMVQACHSANSGDPAGFIITLEDGINIYHAGDTGIFESMELLGRIYGIDLALLPIGSVFTMDPLQAVYALNLLKPRFAIPMHFGTFPILVQRADHFIELAKEKAPAVEVVALEPGNTYHIN